MINDKPFITAMVQDYADTPPATFQDAADISKAALQLWQCMQQVQELAGKLYSHAGPIGKAFLILCQDSVEDFLKAALQLWQCMQQVQELAGKLYSHAEPIGKSLKLMKDFCQRLLESCPHINPDMPVTCRGSLERSLICVYKTQMPCLYSSI